ncbi:MAG: hypothetical protein QG635_1760, partial [Bacteroidota bacterium]|nr:hypothetical protein [Bacteroidota bacterium]
GTKKGGVYTALEVSPVNDYIIYGGTNAGEFVVSTDGGISWDSTSENLTVNRYMTDITASLTEENVVYITFSGFGNNHVYKSTDYGQTWADIGASLPDVPCNALAINPDSPKNLFLATDIGVYTSYDDGQTWAPFGRGLPNSPVNDITFHLDRTVLPALTLRAATHGRSIWEIDVPAAPIDEAAIIVPAGGEIYVSGTAHPVRWYNFQLPVRVEYTTNDGNNWRVIADNVSGNSLLWMVPHTSGTHCRIKVTSVQNESQTKQSNYFSIELVHKGSLLNMKTKNYIPYGIAYDGVGSIWTSNFYGNTAYKLNGETFEIESSFKLPADSLFSDLTIDRQKNIMYIHKIYTTSSPHGGLIYKLDLNQNGKLLKSMPSPTRTYPIGLELMDGKLVCSDRDGGRKIYVINPETGEKLNELDNPFQVESGPRGLCYDGSQYLYQVSTSFPGGSLTGAYILKIDKNNMTAEVDRMNLETANGIINARGVDFDPRDESFWISDYGTNSGSIYKIAGFNPKVSVDENMIFASENIQIDASAYPNPLKELTNISFSLPVKNGSVKVDIVDILGNTIGTLFDKYVFAGYPNSIQYDGKSLASGAYYLVFSVDGTLAKTLKLIVLK